MDTERTCLELALEGERHCKAGDCRKGVYFFEAAIQNGTSNLRTLSAIYSQLGNAYFYLQDYEKALEYHSHDLNLAKTINDRLGEAKANGNIGNTHKVLGQFDEALYYCKQHLKISMQLKDKIGEARALYNIGNVLHAKAKSIGIGSDEEPGHYPRHVEDCLLSAVDNYLKNLALVVELNDKAAQGRVYGNLGNTYYLLGDFEKAIHYHQLRLAIAKEFGDKAGERRAYSNLGNAYIFTGDFQQAALQYKQTLQISRQLGDRALEAQACYNLGNTYTLLGDFQQAIEYHVLHMKIARELQDLVGEARACWSLGNAHTALGQSEQAAEYAVRHRDISLQLGDIDTPASADLNPLLGTNLSGIRLDGVDTTDVGPTRNYRNATGTNLVTSNKPVESSKTIPDSYVEVTPISSRSTVGNSAQLQTQPRGQATVNSDDLFELISRSQSRRIDDQRYSLRHAGPLTVRNHNSDSLAKQEPVPIKDETPRTHGAVRSKDKDDDQFFDLLLRSQGSRLEEQRSSLRRPASTTVPDDDFFSLVQRLQSSRLETQRSTMPSKAFQPPTSMPPPSSIAEKDKKSSKKGK